MDALCQPRTSPKDIHGRLSEKSLKSELFTPDVTCAAHFAGSHSLGYGSFYPSLFGVRGTKLGGLFSIASLLKCSIRLFIGVQDQPTCRTVGTLLMERTRLTNRLREPAAHNWFPMPIANRSSTLTRLRRRSANRPGSNPVSESFLHQL
jgi:hypothetical protein